MKGQIEIKVRGYHCDMFGHINNARYLELLEEARWSAFEDSEFTPADFSVRGWAFIVVNINISYRSEGRVGDTIRIVTDLARIGTKSITLSQKIEEKESGRLIADAEVTFVIMDQKQGKAIPVPEEVKDHWFGAAV